MYEFLFNLSLFFALAALSDSINAGRLKDD